uniref:non-specific serine/threonine protein kinase n=1 Tax=Oryza rufipogon TaxID=4529 RepID=A0A0E0Q9H7_ORYRU
MLRRSLVAHAVLLFAAVALPLAAAQPWPVCGTSGGTYTAGSKYETNLDNLALILSGNASSSLFASGTVGSSPNTVYGLLLCRGDINPSDCADCGTLVVQDVGQACNRTKDKILVYNQCYAQFSNRGDFLAATNNSGEYSLLISGTNITSTDVAGYDRAVTELLNATVRYAVENSTRLFATGQRVGNDTGFSNIYSMAQCSPDLSPAQCRSCLDGLVGQWWKTFPLNGKGARVAGPRCYLRSELGPFYTGSPMVRLPVKADGLTPASAPAPDVVPAITGGKNNSGSKILVIILPIVSVAIIMAVISLCIWNARKKRRLAKAERHPGTDTNEDFESVQSTLLSLASLQVATDNFHESNKIGEGGFGAVYKGILHGQEVAVKRMAKGSNQGLEELKNELVLVAKLHHRNLVRLVGFCLDEGERLLIYEYMSNKSLDTFLFEQKRKLDWAVRFKIIEGIARGLQYLHQDSQKKIVHRDMKASNILLDADMNPKIGDFGLARLFGQDQTREVTSRIAGTFGYMPPEYVLRGQYSTKSDVFSFGILVIEIVTGRRRNSGPYLSEQNDEDILSIVRRHWEEGAIAEMIDHSLGRNYSETEVLKCVNIGLLCVQQNPVDRPTMADVMILLNSDTTCTMPALAPRPAYLIDGTSGYSQTVTQWSGSPTIEQACSDGAMRRRSSVLHAVLLLLVVAAVALPLAAAQPWPVCGTSGGNYTAGNTYESNLLRLASTLRANASASPTLFASGVRGAGPDAVYGLLLCRGDMNPSDCFDCSTRVGDDVAQACNRTKDAILVYNQCYAQFSDTGDFLAATNNSGAYSLLISGTNISSADVAGYDRAVTELLNATVRYAVENSTRLFATGQRVGADPGFRNIYSMAQCSPDLSPAQCRSCLDGLVGQWWTGFLFPRNGEGARVAGPRCYLRSELGSGFYTGAPMVLLRADGLSPASAPAPDVVPATTLVKKNSASKILVIALLIVAVAIVAATSLCMWTVRKKSRSAKAEHLSELDASEDLESVKSTLLTLGSLQVATDNFDESKKLGEGGFGAVYKVWRHWTEGNIVEMIDYSLDRNYPEAEVQKCVNIGLLCVQQNPVDRPTMADVMILLNSDATSSLPAPMAHRPIYLSDGSSATSSTGAMLRRRRSSSVVHAVLFFAAVVLPLAATQPWPQCGNGSTFTAGSTYETNLKNLALTLRANASSSPTLFASGALGSAPDTVYGLLLCRGDLSSSDCADCGTRVGDDVAQACNRTKDAILVYNQCYAQFSDRGDFLAATNNSGVYSLLISGTNISSADVAGYDRAVIELLNATVQYAVENSTRLFATGQRVGTDPGFRNIYSMAQCSPDLSPALCRRCLDDLVGRWWKLFPLNGEGARVAGPRCYLRSELGSGPFYTGNPMVQLPVKADGLTPAPDVVLAITGGTNNSASKILVITLPTVTVAIVAAISLCIWNVRKKRSLARYSRPDTTEDFESVKSGLLSLASLQVATDNFHKSKKIGEGGFGEVYQGLLSGQEVAVKRMAKDSHQGLQELKNELILVAKLHHKNLVRLVGFCLEKGERLLVYEYMPNKSLDTLLFDTEQRKRLDWATRFKIIEGTARGLQYLHQDSQKKIVHRDMKASNILLDADMNPKIGDFGLAKLFAQDQTREVTSRIAGTFGYMPPEYVMCGQYSTKSDVFSFGILVIEIVTGQRRNSGPYFSEQNGVDILSIVWRHWEEGTTAEMIDHSLGRNYNEAEVVKCINIGLLCVQQNPVDRPTMADVMVLLNSDATCSLPAPAPRPTSLIDGSSGYSTGYSTEWSGCNQLLQTLAERASSGDSRASGGGGGGSGTGTEGFRCGDATSCSAFHHPTTASAKLL